MHNAKRKILVCVEGEKIDVRLMERLFRLYGIDARYEIVPYKTNIYALYNTMFHEGDPQSLDLLQVLKEHEPIGERKQLFDEKYSDILLVFDMDPQDPQFLPDKLVRMAEFFRESTDTGKLYINYPMVEAFYHMSSIPDPGYNDRYATYAELMSRDYKTRVNHENRNRDYTKFAVTKEECNIVIRQNMEKAEMLAGHTDSQEQPTPSQTDILNTQIKFFTQQKIVSVLSTCAFFIADYNPGLLS